VRSATSCTPFPWPRRCGAPSRTRGSIGSSARSTAKSSISCQIDRRLAIDDRAGAGDGTRMLAAIRELRRTHYDVALDLQGLLKSAVLARSAGARRVVGFSSRPSASG
jgi:hypothetical protein